MENDKSHLSFSKTTKTFRKILILVIRRAQYSKMKGNVWKTRRISCICNSIIVGMGEAGGLEIQGSVSQKNHTKQKQKLKIEKVIVNT